MSPTSMSYGRALLGATLVILLLAFSLNAYACLVPIYGGVMTEAGSDCSSPDEQPARQFCDHFKTLGVQAAPDFPSPIDGAAVIPEQPLSSASLCSLQAKRLVLLHWTNDPLPRGPHDTSMVLRL